MKFSLSKKKWIVRITLLALITLLLRTCFFSTCGYNSYELKDDEWIGTEVTPNFKGFLIRNIDSYSESTRRSLRGHCHQSVNASNMFVRESAWEIRKKNMSEDDLAVVHSNNIERIDNNQCVVNRRVFYKSPYTAVDSPDFLGFYVLECKGEEVWVTARKRDDNALKHFH